MAMSIPLTHFWATRTNKTHTTEFRPMRKATRFDELFLPHLDAAYNLARWLVERDQDAQAVVQEAYIQAPREIVGFRGADARAWLLTIVRNTAYTWMQKRGYYSNMTAFEEAIHLAPYGKRLLGPTDDERKQQLHIALSRLPVEFREVLVLHEIEGWSCTQLAAALDISVATVVSRLTCARWSLRGLAAGIQGEDLHDEL
jgi:RNA polymerase sigma-70 factor (ECF subfamily)